MENRIRQAIHPWHTILIVLNLIAASVLAAVEKPNIIFILADDWGRGDINVYGGDQCQIDTPHMDRLARQGRLYTDAHSSSSVCTPTRYSVLTGRYNWRTSLKNGVLYGFSESLIEPGRETVASFLKQSGYATAMIGKSHLGMGFPTTDGKPADCTAKTVEELETLCNVDWSGRITNGPNDWGFDYFWGISASLDMPPYIWIENDHFVGRPTTIKTFFRTGPAHEDFEDYDVLPMLVTKSVDYIEQVGGEDPFFLYMPLNSPHTPISPSESWQGKSELGPYGDFVMETDWAIGEVVKAVERNGLAENTLIIVTADNGCSPAARGGDPNDWIRFREGEAGPFEADMHYPSDILRGHKADIYEGGHRVPFIARWDGKVEAGSVSDDLVCLVDLFATCADILDVDVDEAAAVDSHSMLPSLLGDPEGSIRETVVHHSINGSFALREGKWKLAFCPGSGGWSLPRPYNNRDRTKEVNPRALEDWEWVQLFDLENDPSETTNLANRHPDIVESMTALAESYIANGRSTPGNLLENDGETHLTPQWIRGGLTRIVVQQRLPRRRTVLTPMWLR